MSVVSGGYNERIFGYTMYDRGDVNRVSLSLGSNVVQTSISMNINP